MTLKKLFGVEIEKIYSFQLDHDIREYRVEPGSIKIDSNTLADAHGGSYISGWVVSWTARGSGYQNSVPLSKILIVTEKLEKTP